MDSQRSPHGILHQGRQFQTYIVNNIGDGHKAEITYSLNTDNNLNDTKNRNVLLMINPTNNSNTISSKISNRTFDTNNSLCKTLLGIYSITVNDDITNESRLIIHGLLPNGPASKSGKLKIGDLLVSINDFHINAENIENLLSAIKEPKLITLTVQSPLKYLKINENQIYSTNSSLIRVTSKQNDIVQGTRLKETHITHEFPYMALILQFEPSNKTTNNDAKEKDIDIIYQYPQQDDLLLTIRGMFVTLASSLHDINNEEIKSCKLNYANHLMNIKFIVTKTSILIIALPKDRLNDYLYEHLMKDLNNTIQFAYDGLHRLTQNDDLKSITLNSTFDKTSLDNLFSTFFQRILLNTHLLNMKSIRYNDEIKKRIFYNALPWLELPNDIKLNIDTQLCSFEAQEFIDSDGLYFKFQRHFDIVGSCLFFKTYLVQTHLSNDITLNIYKYCDNLGLLILSSNNITRQIQIWKEVFINTQNKNNLKHYILIIGLKEFLLVVLVEYGDVSRRVENNYAAMSPDPLLVEQTKSVLNEMNRFDVLKDINDWYLKGTLPRIISPDRLLLTKNDKPNAAKLDIDNQERNSKNSIEDLTADLSTKKSSFNLSYDSDSGEASQRSSQTKAISFKSLDDFYCNYQNFPDNYLNGRVFNYIISEENSNGILITPTKIDIDLVNTVLYQKILNNFTDNCINIKKFFDKQIRYVSATAQLIPNLTEQHDYIEHGVLFTIRNPLKKAKSQERLNEDDKKRSKSLENEMRNGNSFAFWVIGRRVSKPYKRDFFICFHDKINTLLQELAFDIGFNRGAF